MAELCTAVAAVRLMFFYPFWCELFYSMKVIENRTVRTLQTDGVRLWVNPEFYNALALDYKITAVAHEVCHKMLHHCTRGLTFLAPWDNIAADIVVNTMLADNGFKIHPTWVQPESKYRGWTFEAVYHDLIRNLPKPPKGGGGGKGTPQPGQGQPQPGQGQPQPGQGQPGQGQPGHQPGQPQPGTGNQQGVSGNQPGVPGTGLGGTPTDETFDGLPKQWKDAWKDIQKFKGTSAEIENHEQQVEQQVAAAISTARMAGKLPAGVEMAMDGIRIVTAEKWYDHLARYMQSLSVSEYNWSRINRRNAVLYDVVSPDIYSESLGDAIILVDASGSVYNALAQQNFAAHINAILGEAKPRRVIVAYFDTMIHKHVELDPGEIDFEEQPQGGGGTSFVQPLEWVMEQDFNPAVVIVLTDLMGTFPDEEPPFPVVWASIEPGKAPFGETIHVK